MKTYSGECLMAALSTVLQEDYTKYNCNHIEQMRDLIDKDFITLERYPDCYSIQEGNDRFREYLFAKKAILLIEEPIPHAIAWTLQGLYDGHKKLESIPDGVKHALIII
jgi:hypothetical protein